MTLFAALTSKDGDAGGPSTSSPPEAIQLHSDRVIDFLNGTTVHLLKSSSHKSSGEEPGKEESTNINTASSDEHSRYFSALSYQAIQTQQDDGPLPNKSPAGGAVALAQRHLRPDLGVWNCRVNGKNPEVSVKLLKRVVIGNKKQHQLKDAGDAAADKNNNSGGPSPPIVMAVDLSDPADVQPVVELMRNVILQLYDPNEKSAATSDDDPRQVQCTTSAKALQSSVFGKTLIQEGVTVKGSSASNGQLFALILAVIVPSTINSVASTIAAEEYKEQQARALLLYHLHKFSLEVNCTLCFVSETKSPDIPLGGVEGESKEAETPSLESDPLLGRNTTMTIDDLGKVIRRVAMGLSPLEQSVITEQTNEREKQEKTNDESKEQENDSLSQRPPSIHVPGSHDNELIHGAYLRNASCEGRWDASKDDLAVALSPPKNILESKGDKEEKTCGGGGGDEEWLSQLASSIGFLPDAATITTTLPGEALTPAASDKEEKRRQLKKSQSLKKRQARKPAASRNKDSKPKDEKEVMNFFDNLLKK